MEPGKNPTWGTLSGEDSLFCTHLLNLPIWWDTEEGLPHGAKCTGMVGLVFPEIMAQYRYPALLVVETPPIWWCDCRYGIYDMIVWHPHIHMRDERWSKASPHGPCGPSVCIGPERKSGRAWVNSLIQECCLCIVLGLVVRGRKRKVCSAISASSYFLWLYAPFPHCTFETLWFPGCRGSKLRAFSH